MCVELQALGEEKASQFFYDMNAPMEDNKQKRKNQGDRRGDHQDKRPRQTGPCWFCKSITFFQLIYVIRTFCLLFKASLDQKLRSTWW